MATGTVHPAELELAHEAAQCVVRTHRRIAEFIRAGQTLGQIDREIARILHDLDCQSCFKDYQIGLGPKFPSHACLSLNDCVVHGTAGAVTRPLVAGDVLKIDIGVWHKGFVGDAAWTYAIKDYPSAEVRRLMECGKESLRRGVQTLHPDNTWLEWARTVQECVEGEFGFHLVRGLGGHGYGKKTGKACRNWGLHGPPFVSNVVPEYASDWPESTQRCAPGTLVAVEPMIAVGTGATRQRGNEWPVYSLDGSMTVHYEHDVYIGADGPRVLTHGLEEQPDVVG
jgi:methionyl aminopeptidase